jgi:hypothetical protein
LGDVHTGDDDSDRTIGWSVLADVCWKRR